MEPKMPAPLALAPLAWKAAALGAGAAALWLAARRPPEGPRGLWRERALDDLGEGLEAGAARAPDEARADAAARWRRTLRLGAAGPGVEIDLAALFRARLRRA